MNGPSLPSRLPRVRAEIRLDFARAGVRTEAARAFETGGWRLRFPRVAGLCEAVVVNTGGGMAGGDRVEIAISAGPGARALVTSQSQEKIYRAEGLASLARVKLRVEAGASLVWAPQETLLFEGARLDRALEADVAPDATLTLIEALAFGRLAHGEVSVDAEVADRWRLRRAGRLVFAEALRIAQAGATLDRPAVGAGARALATIVRIGPDAPAKREPLRAALDAVEGLDAGASVIGEVLVARLVAKTGQTLRAGLVAAWSTLEGRDAPRVWY